MTDLEQETEAVVNDLHRAIAASRLARETPNCGACNACDALVTWTPNFARHATARGAWLDSQGFEDSSHPYPHEHAASM